MRRTVSRANPAVPWSCGSQLRAAGLRGVLALGELLNDLGAEGGQVVRAATGHQALIGDHLPIDPGERHERDDVPYHKYAELLGLRGIYCDDPDQVGKAWEEALASDVPVVLEFKTDPEIPPLPPHIMKDQAKESVKAAVHDPQRMGLASHGFRQKIAEIFEKLPGRDK